jgi:hypothetical protein
MPEGLRGVVGALLCQTLHLALALTLLTRVALLELPVEPPPLLARRLGLLMIVSVCLVGHGKPS